MKNKKILLFANAAANYIRGAYSGINRVTFDLINEIGKFQDKQIDIELYTQGLRDKRNLFENNFLRKHHLFVPNILIPKKVYTLLPIRESVIKYDLIHIPHNFDYCFDPSRVILTIHDTLYFSFPENFLGHEFARNYYPKLANKVVAIATCSESSKADIVYYLGVKPEKITVIPWGVNRNIFHVLDKTYTREKLIEILGFTSPFFLCVSCDIGRKNTISVLRAFKRRANSFSCFKLLLLWNTPPQEYLKEFSYEIQCNKIIFLSNIKDCDLNVLYNGAVATWFPSKYEGFGLPVIESMTCGTPVVTSPNSSLIEVGGDDAIYVDPNNIDEMEQVMLDFELGKYDLDALQQKVLIHAGKFSWDNSAKKYINWYKSLVQ
jgi:glycosyltransferase involved in cell wall biosynthesis